MQTPCSTNNTDRAAPNAPCAPAVREPTLLTLNELLEYEQTLRYQFPRDRYTNETVDEHESRLRGKMMYYLRANLNSGSEIVAAMREYDNSHGTVATRLSF